MRKRKGPTVTGLMAKYRGTRRALDDLLRALDGVRIKRSIEDLRSFGGMRAMSDLDALAFSRELLDRRIADALSAQWAKERNILRWLRHVEPELRAEQQDARPHTTPPTHTE